MPKLFLHIGTEKTGSTSIQDTLFKNHHALLKQGILYPKCFGRANHVELVVTAQEVSKDSELYAVVGLDDPKTNISNFRLSVYETLKEEVLLSGAHTVILSNEHLHSRLTIENEIERLMLHLTGIFEEIVVVSYFREQLDLVLSHYSTKIKSGDIAPFTLPEIDPLPHYYDYNGLVMMWEKFFSSIECREFSRKRLIGGDVVSDFLNVIGCDDEDIEYLESTNESLGFDVLEVLRGLNEHIPLVVKGKLNPERKSLVSIFEGINSNIKIPINLADSENFRSYFVDGNKLLRERYALGDEFLNDFKEHSNPPYTLSVTDYSLIFYEFWKCVQRKIDWQASKVSELEKKLTEFSKKS